MNRKIEMDGWMRGTKGKERKGKERRGVLIGD